MADVNPVFVVTIEIKIDFCQTAELAEFVAMNLVHSNEAKIVSIKEVREESL